MSEYKLYYFNSKGRAECSRMLFALSDKKYEDVRVVDAEKLQNLLQNRAPFGQVPLLEVDGETFCQSKAIERLIANRFGLNGGTDLEKAKSDMIADCVEDMVRQMPDIRSMESEKERIEKHKAFIESSSLSRHLTFFEKMINPAGFFIGNNLTWADISLYNGLFTNTLWLGINLTDAVAKFPKVRKLCNNVESHPKIASWIERRPDSAF